MKSPEVRRQEAEARAEAWRKLTPEEQLAQLDRRDLHKGAVRQRRRIEAEVLARRRSILLAGS